jgi:hypothetical protein
MMPSEADVTLKHGAEFRRCLIELDVKGIRRLWQHVSPHLPQPKSDDEALHTLHLARTKVPNLPSHLREYSAAWLKEREGKVAWGVGVSVIAPARRAQRALEVREAMNEAVRDSIKAGVCLETEADEVRNRMAKARDAV